MRIGLLTFLLLLSAACLAADVQIGDTREMVIKKMGRPVGRLTLRDKEILTYNRGTIELADGKVTLAKLVSAGEAAVIVREREETVQAGEFARQKHQKEADAAKTQLLGSTAYKTNSVAGEIAMLEELKKAYPELAESQDFNAAVGELQNAERSSGSEVTIAEPKDYPRLSGSKRKKYRRARDTNMVEITEGEAAP